MLRKITLLFLACLGFYYAANAQACGFDLKHQQMMAQDPAFAQTVQQMNANLAAMIQSNPNALIVNGPNGPVYQIPLVIHVIHTGGAVGSNYNPTDVQLTGMVNYLNQSYAATWPSYPSATTGGTFIPLQFVLAKRTPTCGTTNGILRVNGSGVAGYTSGGIDLDGTVPAADEVTVKALSIWPNTMYYNIWIVNKIDGADGYPGSPSPFTAGYAYFPGIAANKDGTVMLASQAMAGEITLPHEVGHAFSVYHTFNDDNGGSTCPPNANCVTDGDLVCDTDPHKRSVFNCPTGTNSCTGSPFGTVVHNFMDYSSCQDRFTSGQKTRIMNALLTATSRSGLISSLGGTAIGAAVTTACVPPGITNPGSNSGPRNITVSDAALTYMAVTSSGYTGDGNQYYIDNTCKHLLDVTANQSYNFSVRTGPNAENVKVFVDYNNDGTFQANEQVYTHIGSIANEIHSFTYTVPNSTTIPGLVSCLALRMRVVSDRTIGPAVTACGQLGYGQAEDYSIIIRGGGPTTGAVSIALTTGTNPSCVASSLGFTATPSTGITSPTYLWYVNGVSTGVTTNPYTSSSFIDGDVVSVKMYFNGACGPDSSTSAGFTVNRATSVPASVSIALTSGSNPGCAGQTLVFTATPGNGGTAPAFQWKVNGANAGTNSDTFSGVFNNNDIITVEMTSNSGCASPTVATSSSITVAQAVVTANITIGVISGNNPSCEGKSITFESQIVNGGANPLVQWFVNGSPVAGATNSIFTTATLGNGDEVFAEFTATDACVSNVKDSSNLITMIVLPTDTPTVAITITAGSNPGCLDSLIEFTAAANNVGFAAGLEWLLNGTVVATGLVYSSTTLQNADVVEFRAIATDGGCHLTDTTIATEVLQLSPTPAPPVISFIGNNLVASLPGPLIWYGSSGVVPGVTGQSWQPTTGGIYYAVANNNGCPSVTSNKLTISLLQISNYDMQQVKIYPNPTDGILVLDWGTKMVNMKIDVFSTTGQGLMHEEIKGQSRKTLNLSHFANGVYFIVVRDETGKAGTMRIAVTK